MTVELKDGETIVVALFGTYTRKSLIKFLGYSRCWARARAIHKFWRSTPQNGHTYSGWELDRNKRHDASMRERIAFFHARKLDAQRELEAYVHGLESEILILRDRLEQMEKARED